MTLVDSEVLLCVNKEPLRFSFSGALLAAYVAEEKKEEEEDSITALRTAPIVW